MVQRYRLQGGNSMDGGQVGSAGIRAGAAAERQAAGERQTAAAWETGRQQAAATWDTGQLQAAARLDLPHRTLTEQAAGSGPCISEPSRTSVSAPDRSHAWQSSYDS